MFNRLNIYTNYSSFTQNPHYYSDFRPEEYYFWNFYSQWKLVSNPALKPMRTGKLFAGIKGILWKNLVADLSYLITSIDNYIYRQEIIGAYPHDYVTMVNAKNRITTNGVISQ